MKRTRPLQRSCDREIILSPEDYLHVVSRVVRLIHFRLVFSTHPPPFHILACLVGPVASLFRLPTCLTSTRSEGRYASPAVFAPARAGSPILPATFSLGHVRTFCGFTPWSSSPASARGRCPPAFPTHLIDHSLDSSYPKHLTSLSFSRCSPSLFLAFLSLLILSLPPPLVPPVLSH